MVATPVVHNQHWISVLVQGQFGAGLPVVVHQPEGFGADYIRHGCAAARSTAAGAVAIVGIAPLRVDQDFVGAVDFRQPCAGVSGRVPVGVVDFRQETVGGLDYLRAGFGVDLQDFVEVGGFRHRRHRLTPGNGRRGRVRRRQRRPAGGNEAMLPSYAGDVIPAGTPPGGWGWAGRAGG